MKEESKEGIRKKIGVIIHNKERKRWGWKEKKEHMEEEKIRKRKEEVQTEKIKSEGRKCQKFN